MPLLAARPEPNDGGYAVTDYGAVEPALGTIDDLRALAADLRAHGMALCIDVVLNHTAREHAWARAALQGDERKLAYYRTFPDRTEPDEYERTLPEIFPDNAPGSFSWVPELGRWVWTTFNEYQWDLDYTNPEVFRAMAEAILRLADVGVDVLRLDAVPFLWKRKGTDCQNQPEVHQLLQALRAVLRIAAPAVGLKAEAIVSPANLVTYLGTGRHEGKECDLAYNNVLMALLWSSLGVEPRGADDARPRLRCRRCRRAPGGSPTCAATTTSAGRSRRRTPGPSARTRTCTGASCRTSTRASSRARSRAARGSSRTTRPARRARAAWRPRWRGWRRRRGAATSSRASWRSGACSCSTRWRSRTAGCR